MDVDPKDLIEATQSTDPQREARSARLNAAVAVTVALLATFMGICKVKDDNIVQAMQQAQATATQLELARLGASPQNLPSYDAAVAKHLAVAEVVLRKMACLATRAVRITRYLLSSPLTGC